MTEIVEFYSLEPHKREPKPYHFQIMNAAALICGLCGKYIAGAGGGFPAVCKPCGDALDRGELVGCVKWDNSVVADEPERT